MTICAASNLSVTDNFGVTVASTYDPRDLLTSRSWHGGGIDPARVDMVYDARGDRTSIHRFADLAGAQQIGRSAFAYDAKGRLTDATHFDALDAALADYDYQYDAANQITRQVYNGETSDYTYDAVGQLTDAVFSGQADEDYSYDANGNRIDMGLVVGPNNQILSDGTFDYAYDAEGNLIRRTEIGTGEVTEYSYDHRNRLTHVALRDANGVLLAEMSYTYDAFDRRISKTVDADGDGPGEAETTNYVYDGDHVWADLDASGDVIARYLFGDRIDEILARWQPGNGTAWYLTDRLGTVRDIVNALGVQINHIDYDSFGNVILETNVAAGDRFKFTGREFDAETGLYYYRARYFDAGLGRFISQDPLGFGAGDTNLYRYVENAPTNATDPFGLASTFENSIMTRLAAARAFVVSYIGRITSTLLSNAALVFVIGGPVPPITKLDLALCLVQARAAYAAVKAARAAKAVAKGATRALTQAEQRAVRKINNTTRDHLKPHDYTGTLRDMVGNPVPRPGGGYYDHIQEMSEALRGLRKHAKTLKDAIDPVAATARERALDAIKRIEELGKGLGI